ncbi:MAG TPA: CBS domain-containing protein [Polyangiaceae bacterium]|jgi:acetoin utilization protein AcuB|nr:CBS domain-containing protein [Polyangiaceae bacterium]
MVVSEIMSEKPYAVRVSDRIATLRAKLKEADIRHLPVVEAGQLVGIVSERDLPPLFLGTDGEVSPDPDSDSVVAIMSSDVVVVEPETEVDDVIDLMIEHRIGALPVVEAGSRHLVGIVSYIDVLRAAKGAL